MTQIVDSRPLLPNFYNESDACRALGFETRLRLLYLLNAGTQNIADICKKLELTEEMAMQQLGVLFGQQWVLRNHSTPQIAYYLNREYVNIQDDGTLCVTIPSTGSTIILTPKQQE